MILASLLARGLPLGWRTLATLGRTRAHQLRGTACLVSLHVHARRGMVPMVHKQSIKLRRFDQAINQRRKTATGD